MGFTYPKGLDSAKVAEWLNARRRDGRPVELPAGVDAFTPAVAAKLLGVTTKAAGKALERRGLTATGRGKARRIPRAAVEALSVAAARGIGTEQVNHYTRAAKGFTRWLTRTRRMGANPFDTLTLVNAAVDVRHARRELTADELRRLFDATRARGRSFRGLTGPDRYMLYLTAAGTGFRAGAMANLTPADFDTEAATVTLPARFNKSRKLKVQPLPSGVAVALDANLTGKPAGEHVWCGTWRGKAAEMLRADLEAAGIAYAVEGRDGPEHADFHALRHAYPTMFGRAGVDLRTAQELAGHSTPTLTARYSPVRLRDLTGAVGKLPSLVASSGGAENPSPLPKIETVAGVVPGVVDGGAGPHFTAPSEGQQGVRWNPKKCKGPALHSTVPHRMASEMKSGQSRG